MTINAAFRREYGLREPHVNSSWRPAKPGGPVSEESNGECRQCGEPIFWVDAKESGKPVACNPTLAVHDRRIYDEQGAVLPSGYGRVCHWDTCTKDKATPVRGPGDEVQRTAVLAAIAQTFSLEEIRSLRTELSRLVGIMDRCGVSSESPQRVRTMLLDAMSQGWSGRGVA